jgi:hypothetical protein
MKNVISIIIVLFAVFLCKQVYATPFHYDSFESKIMDRIVEPKINQIELLFDHNPVRAERKFDKLEARIDQISENRGITVPFDFDGYRSSHGFHNSSNNVSPVPEPGTFMLLAVGLAGLIGYQKRHPKR